MRVLLVKTSSMGDVIHTLPALSDACAAIPGVQFDWLVEEDFSAIAGWHAGVREVIPVALRQWRRNLLAQSTRQAWGALRQQLHQQSYDLVLDAQGLLKSALLCLQAKGVRAGYGFSSVRESLAALAYHRRYQVDNNQHAIVRTRSLFSQALFYPQPESAPDFGIGRQLFAASHQADPYIVFLHATTWASKQWPETYWQALVGLAAAAGYRVKLSGGNAEELARAERIAAGQTTVDVLPRQQIASMAELLVNAKAVVAVDTGFGHLAAALNVPVVSVYGPTNPVYTAAIGRRSVQLAADFPCAPCLKRTCAYSKPAAVSPACYATLPPERVWESVMAISSLPV